MKTHSAYILIIVAALGVGATALLWKDAPPPPADIPVQESVVDEQTERPRPTTWVRKEPEPDPQPVKRKPAPPAKVAAPPVKKRPVDQQARREAAARRYWEQQIQRFNRQIEQLMREKDPARRRNLIQSISRYVRFDTLGTIEWAMHMADPDEQRAALEAINKNALSGIGARIETDETGFPKIRDTTVLSAVAATGQVEQGDYIVGMQDGSGEPIYFEGLSTGQVASHLRGKPGTEIRLIMERVPEDGSSPQSFDVNIQRSLLVIQPPF